MSRRRTSLAPATPLDDEDLLREILLRLSPKPSSLRRASLVCKLWHNILSDPQFLNRLRKHHRKPPLIGFFVGDHYGTRRVFAPLNLERFSMPWTFNTGWNWKMVDSRHSLVVLINRSRREIVVWDPLTGQHHCFNFPPRPNIEKLNWSWHAAVLCVDTQDGHVHGDWFSCPFKLVLICGGYKQASAWLYESPSRVWGNIVSTATTDTICSRRHSVLVGNTLYWLFSRGDVLAFDFERQHFDVIEKPANARITNYPLFSTYEQKMVDLASPFYWINRPSNYGRGNLTVLVLSDGCCCRKLFHLTGCFRVFHLRGRFRREYIIRHIMKRNDISYDTFYPYTNFYTAGRGVGWKCLDLKL